MHSPALRNAQELTKQILWWSERVIAIWYIHDPFAGWTSGSINITQVGRLEYPNISEDLDDSRFFEVLKSRRIVVHSFEGLRVLCTAIMSGDSGRLTYAHKTSFFSRTDTWTGNTAQRWPSECSFCRTLNEAKGPCNWVQGLQFCRLLVLWKFVYKNIQTSSNLCFNRSTGNTYHWVGLN